MLRRRSVGSYSLQAFAVERSMPFTAGRLDNVIAANKPVMLPHQSLSVTGFPDLSA